MSEVVEMLTEAMRLKGWSIKETAEASGIERTFLNRLVRGYRPPRVKTGRRTAEHDERYRRLAVALGLDVEQFIEVVTHAQESKTTSPGLLNQLGSIRVSPDHDDFRQRYGDLAALVEANRPLDDGSLRSLLKECIEQEIPRGRAQLVFGSIIGKVSRARPRQPEQAVNQHTSYLGLLTPRLSIEVVSEEARLCDAITEELIDLEDEPSLESRLLIARMFSELSYTLKHQERAQAFR